MPLRKKYPRIRILGYGVFSGKSGSVLQSSFYFRKYASFYFWIASGIAYQAIELRHWLRMTTWTKPLLMAKTRRPLLAVYRLRIRRWWSLVFSVIQTDAVFYWQVMPAGSSGFIRLVWPLMPLGRQSTSIKWLSCSTGPTISQPRSTSSLLPNTLAFRELLEIDVHFELRF